MLEPHIKRISIWTHARFAVSKVIWFGSEEPGDDSMPALIQVLDVPKLIFFAIRDVKTELEAAETLDLESAGQAIETLKKKVCTLIGGGDLAIYDPMLFLRIGISQIPANTSDCLVRLDDLFTWLRTEGVDIGHSLKIYRDADQQTDIEFSTESPAPLRKEIDPMDLPQELDLANMAFRAVMNGYGDQNATPKNRLIDYLSKIYPHLKLEAIRRIATVANPDKARGRKSPSKE